MSSRNLLLVDGDADVHQLLTGALQRDGRDIHAVFDGHAAVERLRTLPYDVVVAGQGRNGLSGTRLLRRLRSIRPETKVILTGERSASRAIDAMRAHAYGYVHKPLAIGPLAEMVQHALEAPVWQDDIKILSARPEWVTVDLGATLNAAERTVHLFRELEADLPAQICEDVSAAFRELLLNAIEHGAKGDPHKRVRVSFLRTSRSLAVHIQDPGKGFSLDTISHAAVCNPDDCPTRHVEIRAEQGQRPGGFGILMARNLVDELLYNERGNQVVFVKYLTADK